MTTSLLEAMTRSMTFIETLMDRGGAFASLYRAQAWLPAEEGLAAP